MLKIRLLGQVQIQFDGCDITKKISNKGIALLAILMMQKNRRISRQELLGLLWPESAEDAAKYNLRYNLWQIKKLIPAGSGGEPFLIVTRDFCAVNGGYLYQCDLCQAAEADLCRIEDISQLEILRDLFAGDFLENQHFSGCDVFEEMIIMQRYSLENKKLDLLKKMIAIYFERELEDQCLTALADCEEMDPYDEKNAERRMLLLVNRGNYSEAMRYYQRFYNKLACDIGVEPSESIKKLAGRIRGREVSRAPVYHLETCCLASVDCYWMAEVLGGLAAVEELHIGDYLSPGQIADLSYIQIAFGEKPETTSLARVVSSFMTLIEGVCSEEKTVEIRIQNIDDMDSVSKEVLGLLRNRCGEKLQVIER